MRCPENRVEFIEALRELLDRLCSPDLMLGEAKDLRTELLGLLDRIEREFEPGMTTPAQGAIVTRRSVEQPRIELPPQL